MGQIQITISGGITTYFLRENTSRVSWDLSLQELMHKMVFDFDFDKNW